MDETNNDSEQNLSLREQWEQTATTNEMLKAQLMNMSLINELTRVLHSSTDLQGITKTVLLGMQEILGFDRVILFSIDKTNFRLLPSAWVGVDDKIVQRLSIPMGFEGGEITDAIFLNRHVIVEETDGAADPFATILGSSTYLVMPMTSRASRRCYEEKNCTVTSCPAHGGHNPCCWSINGAGIRLHALTEDDKRRDCVKCVCFKCEGVLWMDRAVRGTALTSDDITMLSAIVNVAGLMMDNFRMFNALETANGELKGTNSQLKVVNHDLQVAQNKINTDLEHARKIQLGLLPQGIADTPAFSLGAQYIPASVVGGDYYDVFELAPSVYGMIVADVSGHGISSALIMSMVKILLKTFAPNELSAQKTLERINKTFMSEVKTDNFVTVFYAVMDTKAHTLTYSSAGHCPILLLDRRTGACTHIKADGLFLGVFEDMMLKEASYRYEPGASRLILYTDGLVECRSPMEEMFEVSRLEQASRDTLTLKPREAIDTILKTQRDFCGTTREPEDDITLLVIDF